MLSNCQAYAWSEYARRVRLWKRAGRPRHCKPWIKMQPSELAPSWVLHASVGGMGMPALEFVPVDRRPLPWWRLLVVLIFTGRIRPADFPQTEPSRHGDLISVPPDNALRTKGGAHGA